MTAVMRQGKESYQMSSLNLNNMLMMLKIFADGQGSNRLPTFNGGFKIEEMNIIYSLMLGNDKELL